MLELLVELLEVLLPEVLDELVLVDVLVDVLVVVPGPLSSSPPQATAPAAPPTISVARPRPRKLSFNLMPIVSSHSMHDAWSNAAPLGQAETYRVSDCRQ